MMGDKPRVKPLRRDEWSPLLRVLLSIMPGGTAEPMNIFTTLARHPSLFRSWLGFGAGLLAGRLSARDRELAILRTAKRCGCEYEWHHHYPFAIEAGITEGELAAIDPAHVDFAWAEGDRLLAKWTDAVFEADPRDVRPSWTRRYWRSRRGLVPERQ